VRRLAPYALVVRTGEVAHARALHLDDACTEVGQVTRRQRRGYRMFERDDRDAVQGSCHRELRQNERGSPSRCSATYERIRLVEMGATWYSRVSRNLRSTSYSLAKPKPPCICRHTLAASQLALAARYFAMLASAPQGWCASNSSQAFQRIRSAASTSMCASAIGN